MGIHREDTLDYLSGSYPLPAVSGGYLYVSFDNELLRIVSIPSPNLMADNNELSKVENEDEFTDNAGNDYSILIVSSKYGVDWRLVTRINDLEMLKKFHYKVKLNEY